MIIVIDNSNLLEGGGLQVSISFLRDLKKCNLVDEFHVIQSLSCVDSMNNEVFPNTFTFYNLKIAEQKSKRKRINRVKQIENLVKPDCIFTLFGPSYHKSDYPKIVGFAIPHIIYPDSPYFNQIGIIECIYYKILAKVKTYSFKKFSDALIFETENARKIFTEREQFNKKSFTVGNTLNEIFFDRNKWIEFEGLSSSACNILFLSGSYLHKNMMIIPDVIRILKDKYHLKDFKFFITLNAVDLSFPEYCNEHIEYLGKVDLEKIPSLYHHSHLIFIPSLLEVFSTTYLEAMLMKKPIVASDLGFSRDICGDSAYFCDPINAESYAHAIFEISTNEDLKNTLIINGTKNLKRFGSSMDRTESYLRIIKSIQNHENTQ